MKITVTGGAGFIGANLCRKLAAEDGFRVTVLDDLSTGRPESLSGVDVELRIGTVLDPEVVRDVCREADAIVHLAAVPSVPRSLADPRRSHEVNTTGTLEILDAARNSSAHVIVASSSSVYGSNSYLPKHEGLTCKPMSPYACSKLAAESYALAYQHCFGVDCTVFRFFNVFGPLQAADHAYAAVVPRFIDCALRGKALPVHGDGTQSRDFTYVGSLVEVLFDTIVRRVTYGGPINLAFGTRTTLNELISCLAELLKRPLDVEHQPGRVGDVPHSQAATEILATLFPDIRPVSLERGLANTIDWMRRFCGEPLERTGVSA